MMLELNYIVVPNNIEIGEGVCLKYFVDDWLKIGENRAQVLAIYCIIFSLSALMLMYTNKICIAYLDYIVYMPIYKYYIMR
jgi:hypothetical protein